VQTGRSGRIFNPQCSQYTATSLRSPKTAPPSEQSLTEEKGVAYWSEGQML
jgi:hypothetical protein